MSSLLFVEKILYELEKIHKGGEGKKYGGILVWLDCTLTLFIFISSRSVNFCWILLTVKI